MIDYGSEVVAWGVPIFEGVKHPAWYALQRLGFRLARLFPPDNLWLVQSGARRMWPFAPYELVQDMLAEEKQRSRRADWFFLVEDDVVPNPDVYERLRDAAHPENRPFVSSLAYCRQWPCGPGVADTRTSGDTNIRTQWEKAPPDGTHKADSVGFCAALFHRSLFDKVPEPWFGVRPPSSKGGYVHDAWWCYQMKKVGLEPYVCCDAEVGHIGEAVVIGRRVSEAIHAKMTETAAGNE